jgi:hypothetical protein
MNLGCLEQEKNTDIQENGENILATQSFVGKVLSILITKDENSIKHMKDELEMLGKTFCTHKNSFTAGLSRKIESFGEESYSTTEPIKLILEGIKTISTEIQKKQ